MNGMNHDWGMGFGFGWIIGLIVLVVVIWLIIKAVNQNRNPNLQNKKSPMDILKKRYARGEIDKEEFEEKKKDIL